jgi:hypothetical protein
VPNGAHMTRVVDLQLSKLGMTMGCSETRSVRVVSRLSLEVRPPSYLTSPVPFAREVNDQLSLSVAAQLPWKDKHASCGRVGGPE